MPLLKPTSINFQAIISSQSVIKTAVWAYVQIEASNVKKTQAYM